MTLQQMFDLTHAKSYYSRSDAEVWHALSNAASTLFLKILEENKGFFIKWDATTVALAVGTEEYTLPADCTQLLRVRERSSSSAPWRVMSPAELNDEQFTDSQFTLGPDMDGPTSEFCYFGPYLLMADAQTSGQKESIRVEPPPQEVRAVELVYVARFVEITAANSAKVIPNEGDEAVMFAAVAQLLGDNGDDPSAAAHQAAENERWFLKWVRSRQKQQQRMVRPYIEDMD